MRSLPSEHSDIWGYGRYQSGPVLLVGAAFWRVRGEEGAGGRGKAHRAVVV